MTDPQPDPFDEIVRKLDLDLPFPEPGPMQPAPPIHPSGASEDEPFYRRVEHRPILPRNPRVLLAWLGVLGAPACIMVTSTMRVILPRPVLLGVGLVFVAAATYLIAQLPERGPGEPYWPDDGAQL